MKNNFKKIIIFLLILFILCSCEAKERTKASTYSPRSVPFQDAFTAFDTECNISIYGKLNEYDANKCISDIKDLIFRYDKMFSKTDVESEVYKINHRDTNEIYTYKEVANIFIISKDFYKWSGKAFDVSGGTLYELWDVKNRKKLPLQTEIEEAISHIGNFNYDVTAINESDKKDSKIIFYGDKNTIYDFGALVKGYVCQVIRDIFKENSKITGAIINLGGNVYCYGNSPNRENKMFRVGIYKPFSSGDIAETVEVKGKCVVTSGNYQRYFKVDGDDRVYHHIINPFDGYPTNNGIDSVTIVTESGLLCDYLSTAVMILGDEKGRELIEKCKSEFNCDIDVIIIYSDGHIVK